MSKSFQLIRTNPKLTTNIKLIVDSNYNLYFESFDSNKELSDQKYKNYLLNTNAMLENEIPKFYDKLPKNLAFYNKTDNDIDIMYNEYNHQFDNIYYAGANEISDNTYKEEFEYFAPLYIKKNELPSNFIILRVDDATIYENIDGQYSISTLNKDNFRKEIINKWKCVNVFDLTNKTNIGKFFDRNINNNSRFPTYSLFFDTKKYNYSKWSGLEYTTGIYKTSEMLIDDKLYYNNPHFNFEEFITNGFENNGLIYPNILNIKFLFDDDPATPEEFKKWSMNRYYGFYIEQMDLIMNLTSYELPKLKSGITIKNNIFLDGTDYVNPFVIESNNDKWIQVDNDFYKVKRQNNGSFKIISDKNLTGYDVSTFNKGQCEIKYENNINIIDVNIDNIDAYINENGEEIDMYADIYLIKIDDIYHILRKNDIGYYIDTDYAIYSDTVSLRYWKGGKDSVYNKQKMISQNNEKPLIYNIYKLKLNDIKDFDYDRINTKYSDFDYEKTEYYDTPEVKLYAKEYRDNSIPKRYKTHDFGEDGQYNIKNISSEYTSGDETFELKSNGNITPILQKNQYVCKWAYTDSISHSDYPYKLNNNYDISGTYNRTVNPNLNVSNIQEKTHDYFYRIGEFYGKSKVDLYEGFNADFELYWSSNDIIRWSYNTSTERMYVNGSNGLNELTFSSDIEINSLYYINIVFNDISNTGTNYEIGIDSGSFNNGTTTQSSGTIVVSVFGLSLSNTLKIFVNEANLYIDSIIVNKIEDKYYLNQSTNIQTKLLSSFDNITDNRFNLNYYIDSNFDYFDYFFNNIMYYNNSGKLYKKSYKKYSVFNGGDNNLPASTLFKGVEYKLYSVEDIVLNAPEGLDETIRKIITDGGNKYNGYKFSVILSENYDQYKFDFDGENYTNPIKINTTNTSINGINKLLSSDKNGLHVIVNDKYKNVLVIINQIIPINIEWYSLNNVDVFNENFGLYFGKTKDNKYNLFPLSGTTIKEYISDNLTAYYYINSLNNLNVKNVYEKYVFYYLIDENGEFANTEMIKFNNSTFTNLQNWDKKFPPFYIDVDIPSDISIKKNSYNTYPIKGPNTNIYDKYLIYSNGIPLAGSYIDEPLSRLIKINDKDDTNNSVNHGEKIYKSFVIDRFDGYYEPIFKDILLFKSKYYWYDSSNDVYNYIDNNYMFNDELDRFGMVDEIIYSKVNEDDNYLKLKDTDNERSYYPMVDEIGVSQTERFIFLSTWDKNFYIKTLNEQTLLENYVEIPEQVIETPTFAEITSVTSPIINQIIWGNILNSSTISFTVNVRNLSESIKSIKVGIKYTNDTYGNVIDMGFQYTPFIVSGDIDSVTFNVNRPTEIKNGQTSYELLTQWRLIATCYNEDDDELDSNNLTQFRVWNDLVHFELSNPTVNNGWTGNHDYDTFQNFSVDVNALYNRPYRIDYWTKMYIDDGTGTYIQVYSDGVSDPIYLTTSLPLTKQTNCWINNAALNIDYGETVNRNVKFYVWYQEWIEGTLEYFSDTLIQSNPKLSITREDSDPILVWYTNTPSIEKDCGVCNSSAYLDYSGDEFTIKNLKIQNNGGLFDGNLTLNLTVYYKTNTGSVFVDTTNTKTVTLNNIQIQNGSIYTVQDIDMNRLNGIYNTPFRSFQLYEYKIVVDATPTIPGTKDSAIINGCIGSVLNYPCLIKPISTTTSSISFSTVTCLDENSIMLMYNGEEKKLKDVMYYEKVLSYKINNELTESLKWEGNIKNGEFTFSRINNISKRKVKGYYVINDGLIKATPQHNMMVYDKSRNIWRWMRIRDIRPGDKLFNNKGGTTEVYSNIYLDAYINIVKIDVEDVDNYFVNGALHHNIKQDITQQ